MVVVVVEVCVADVADELLLFGVVAVDIGMPHPFNSVKISVKKPGSAFMRNIFELKRLTIRRHLKKADTFVKTHVLT